MKVLPAGLTTELIDKWVDQPSRDARTWTLRTGAPEVVVDGFARLVDAFLTSDTQPYEYVRFDATMPAEVKITHPSVLMVRAYQLGRQLNSIVDAGAKIGIDERYVEQIAAVAGELDLIREQIREALLNDQEETSQK